MLLSSPYGPLALLLPNVHSKFPGQPDICQLRNLLSWTIRETKLQSDRFQLTFTQRCFKFLLRPRPGAGTQGWTVFPGGRWGRGPPATLQGRGAGG